jgi:hypothetical protein
MAAFLQFLLFLFLIIVVGGIFVAVYLYRRVHGMAERLRRQMNGESMGDENPWQSAGGQQGGTQERRTTTEDGSEIIDRRDPDKVKQKIFKDDEGEYVDYKEE